MKTLMVQGTTSDAGKSVFVAGLCRVLSRRGNKVSPFKPQNMALNSAVTIDGGEIGRAQALQAQACGIQPHSDMNPILIKPTSDVRAQIIVHGQAQTDMNAAVYQDYKQHAMAAVLQSYERLIKQYDHIIVEGAGSPAEINLRENDIANMGFAEQVDCPVVLIADIDRGGVFAHIVGTLALLSTSEQQRIKGFVINRFRGDLSLLKSGIDWLEAETGKPVFGVLPYLHNLRIDAEDSINHHFEQTVSTGKCRIVVPVLPRISNHTDFDPLRTHPDIQFNYIHIDDQIPEVDIIILPGSKSVRDDCELLMQHGWREALQRHLRYGGKVFGICGGYQMLGSVLHDPEGIEGQPGSFSGFCFLDIETTLMQQKNLANVAGQLSLAGINCDIKGYEIHAGVSKGEGLSQPLIRLATTHDGCISDDGQVAGTYLHGLFESGEAINALLNWAGHTGNHLTDYAQLREQAIDQFADAVEQHINLEQLFS